jgi:N-acetylmuramoyl-L-alanine amidase
LKFGTKITIQSDEAGWAKIVSPSGIIGWENEYYITKDGPSNQQTQPITSTPTSKTTTSDTTDKKSLPPKTKSSSSTDEKSSSPSTKSSDTSGAQMTTQSIKTDNLCKIIRSP